MSSREGEPPAIDRVDWGRSVFRFETFRNEWFWSDTLGLAEGLARREVTPNALLAAGLQLDSDKLPSDFRRSDVGIGPYTDPRATRRLIEANAVIGLVARQDRIGVTCVLCHSRADDRFGDGVGRRVDGLPNTRLRVGTLIAWGERSRSYVPFLNLFGLGRGPQVDPAVSAFDGAEALEGAVDAALLSWPPGQADATPDGVGNPTDIPAIWNLTDVGPYDWDGMFAHVGDAHNYFFGVVLDPTTLATPGGRSFLSGVPPPMGDWLGGAYGAVLQAIDPAMERPRVAADRVGGLPFLRSSPRLGFRVNGEDLDALSAYLARVLPPRRDSIDEERVAAGRRVFRQAGCNDCHLESRETTGMIVPIRDLLPGYDPQRIDLVTVPGGSLLDDPRTGYDDRVMAMNAAWRGGEVGYKVPQLVGIGLTAPYLHDGSVSTLEALLSPDRGAFSPHPFYIRHPDERADIEAFLAAWDGRTYP
ncbi:MAG: hypothetical protein HY207_07570 [Nitrospirae bacterium]|nr:hypothetical protein [Nitrospirota bacterium]